MCMYIHASNQTSYQSSHGVVWWREATGGGECGGGDGGGGNGRGGGGGGDGTAVAATAGSALAPARMAAAVVEEAKVVDEMVAAVTGRWRRYGGRSDGGDGGGRRPARDEPLDERRMRKDHGAAR
jgi:hypothetical protein